MRRLYFIVVSSIAVVVTLSSAAFAEDTWTALHFFAVHTPYPAGGLIQDSAGNLYGELNGDYIHDGAVYRLLPASGKRALEILHRFTTGPRGCAPIGGLTSDAAGNFYGVAGCGEATNDGIVFRLERPATGRTRWNESVLYTFNGGSDGRLPQSRLSFDRAGNLYGTTWQGGAQDAGTVFRLSPPRNGRGSWNETVLYTFTGGADGGEPNEITLGPDDVLYGTTMLGGIYSPTCGQAKCGTVFELRPPAESGGWSETVLHTFVGLDGIWPAAGVTLGADGTLYGTTEFAGTAAAYPDQGIVFALSPPAGSGPWQLRRLHVFDRSPNGVGDPATKLVLGRSGALYGTTLEAHNHAAGSVFELAPPRRGDAPWRLRVLHVFERVRDGYWPDGDLLLGTDGALYGTTFYGGRGGCPIDGECGTAFRVTIPPASARATRRGAERRLSR